ncbi:inositol polyphosphate 1-phosphatase-like [Tubulanus polymorphus]|uniref:inositol polyphosphate 1-phosphatase-like n=1 Tax=Tubulanus polymorphus TaxID=672921 RepID=UPI003DA1F59A
MKVPLSALTEVLIRISEKAADIARKIRSDDTLFALLIQEKTGVDKNKRFVSDFKTLADVLVQEVVRHDVGNVFPGLVAHIQGEENNTFTNLLGESITVEIQDTCEETTNLLARILDNNREASTLLAELVHRQPSSHQSNSTRDDQQLNKVKIEVTADHLGIWIDPIDSTAQYIHGTNTKPNAHGIHVDGLQCATILIGVFDRISGLPIIGVINQPFQHLDEKNQQWRGRAIWGISYNETQVNGGAANNKPDERAVILSSSESKSTQNLISKKYHLQQASGAGYKMLCVIDSLVDSYLLSLTTTYKWDSCAAHAILRSKGGGVVDFTNAVQIMKQGGQASLIQKLYDLQLKYNAANVGADGAARWQNVDGMLAYRNLDDLIELLHELVR